MQFGQERPSRRLISLTPLIDVVFILLVFFMLASSGLDWRAVELSVSSGSGDAQTQSLAVQIRLKADGSLLLGTEPIDIDALRIRMSTTIVKTPKMQIVIDSEPGVRLQRAIDTLDLLTAEGARNVSFSRTR
jgi:biopolymer transport protein ExbD